MRRTLRQRAMREGHQGGMHVPNPDEAAVTVQAAWRSKRVRRAHRRRTVCATAVQRMVRGVLARAKYLGALVRARDRRREEKERLERLR